MSPKTTAYVILPTGTKICEAGYDGAKNLVLDNPAVASIQHIWNESFMIMRLNSRDGSEITTTLRANYVLERVENFRGGQTSDEAWQKFDQK